MSTPGSIGEELQLQLPEVALVEQPCADGVPTFWVQADDLPKVLRTLKQDLPSPYTFLYDLFGTDERLRTKREGLPPADLSVVYSLTSYERNADIRIKAAVSVDEPKVPSISGLWQNANWYEREAFDMFGIKFDNHPDLRRILMPPTWKGHPLRKDHHARATEAGPFTQNAAKEDVEQEALEFKPELFGMARSKPGSDFMFLNLGPQHPGTHGLLRFVLQLDGEEIIDAIPDIGYHHRGAEKMGERQTWHSYIPYTDRIDYFAGCMNELPYVMTVEKLAGIQVPERVKMIRVLLCELFRICSHLAWFGTFAADLGALSPVFFMFSDRERAFDIVEAITGGRMHPAFFRIGGVAMDLPTGWEQLVRDFLTYLPPRLDEYDKLVMGSSILKARTQGLGAYTLKEGIEWGVTGAGLRACGFDWDLRKKRPYSGYEQFEFDIPTAEGGDCYARALVRCEEIRQSLRIVEQCLKNMPEGPYKADHPLALPPVKERTMQDIETLIHHFLSVSWGPVIPAGEACIPIEASKGANSYHLISDGGNMSYRTRIRTPSFPHMQMVPKLARGTTIADLMAILAALDFILADLDR